MTPLAHPRRLAVAAALVLVALTTVGCAGSDGSGDASSSDSAESAPRPASEAPPEAGAADVADGATVSQRRAGDDSELGLEKKLISKGNVALRSDDVAETAFDVIGVADRYAGEVESQESQTDQEGVVVRSRMVLRIPTEGFTEAIGDLSAVAQLVENSSTTEDVTSEVLDKDIRVRLQRRSIERIELLLDRAQSIRDIVNVEAQLSRRQADLASLERQQRYLADQTAMSTLTVSIQQTPEKRQEKAEEATGFLAGLSDGWGAMTSLAVGLATVVGALLPFALVAGVLGFPSWVLLRRRLRRRPAAAAAAA